ncbi:hypothetical protein GGF39_002604 [Coemansia sp. RSA 1721]|nr:hypothetical protein GGF39_002604 [Coemansia sp. RSA 1721]
MSSVYSQSPPVSEIDDFGWNTIQDRLRDSVVAIKSNTAFYFDTEMPGNSTSTGFVVDSEHGLIVSSRHVMETGPVSHKAVFANDIEVPLQPFFYDPVHDFSIFRYNPAELKSFKPTEIPLCPEEAYSGMEFRIVSNDSCEILSVHGGELSQLHRNPPDYQSGYVDYNCFYMQASTSAGSGSSGSPVVNIDGKAVAMMAGRKSNSSSSYFVTLHRLVYALEYVGQGEVPPRGTLQAIFVHVASSEAQRLGLTEELAIEQGVDVEATEGFLKVDSILTSGPADGKLKIGDIILSINEYPINGFLELSEIVDASVGNDVTINIFRDDQFLNVDVSVQDMYSLIPTKLLRVGGAYIHDMSFHLAAETPTPISGVKGMGVSDLNLKNIDNAEKLGEGAQVLILSQGNYGNFEVYTSPIICRGIGCSNDCSCCANPKYYNFENYALDNMPNVYPDNINGSPAVPETAYIKYYVTEINRTPVNTLDDVVRVVKQLKSPGLRDFNQAVANNQHLASGAMPGYDVKIRTVSFTGSESLATIRTNDHYFPAWQASRGPSLDDTWKIEFL